MIAVSDPTRLSDTAESLLRYGGLAVGLAGLVLPGWGSAECSGSRFSPPYTPPGVRRTRQGLAVHAMGLAYTPGTSDAQGIE